MRKIWLCSLLVSMALPAQAETIIIERESPSLTEMFVAPMYTDPAAGYQPLPIPPGPMGYSPYYTPQPRTQKEIEWWQHMDEAMFRPYWKDTPQPQSQQPQVVQPKAPGIRGTAFFVSPNLIVTAYHLFAKGGKPTVYIDGQPTRAELVVYDAAHDIAVVRVPPQQKLCLPIANDYATLGEPVIAVGYPLSKQGATLRTTGGTVTSTRGDGAYDWQYKLNVPVELGNSGGPLLDNCGNVVGVMTTHDQTGASYATKSVVLGQLLDKVIDYQPSYAVAANSTEDMIRLVQDAVIYILVE